MVYSTAAKGAYKILGNAAMWAYNVTLPDYELVEKEMEKLATDHYNAKSNHVAFIDEAVKNLSFYWALESKTHGHTFMRDILDDSFENSWELMS